MSPYLLYSDRKVNEWPIRQKIACMYVDNIYLYAKKSVPTYYIKPYIYAKKEGRRSLVVIVVSFKETQLKLLSHIHQITAYKDKKHEMKWKWQSCFFFIFIKDKYRNRIGIFTFLPTDMNLDLFTYLWTTLLFIFVNSLRLINIQQSRVSGTSFFQILTVINTL